MPSPSSSPSAPVQNDHSGGSNTGAIAGGVGGGVVAVLLVVVLIWWFRRRSQRTRSSQQAQPSETDHFRKQELHADQPMRRHELDAKTRSELDGVGRNSPVQLP